MAIEQGTRQGNIGLAMEGNERLLLREQEDVLEETYSLLQGLGSTLENGFSNMAKNPIVVGGPKFKTVVPDTSERNSSLFEFDDRWQWITHPTQGMTFLWIDAYDDIGRLNEVMIPLLDRVENFAFFPPF